MADVPETPSEFFNQYVPARFADIKDALSGKSSSGCITFRVTDAGEWSLRLEDGDLVIEEGMGEDVIIQVTLDSRDFAAILVEGARQQEAKDQKPENQVVALKAITIDETRANQVRGVAGSVSLVIADGDDTRRLTLTPGSQEAKVDNPDCKLSCQMNDFVDWQEGKIQPMQLVMTGKMRIEGNAQIPMALTAVLA
ncbi:MAG: SCP2 sterol-binding domain-containing protein [Myxococcales bacterium]|nr:SCP2 sterol-binding domain-containing protein [Myxococcales bacterium]